MGSNNNCRLDFRDGDQNMKTREYHLRCWNCGFENNRIRNATDNDDLEPKNGNLSFCYQCGTFAIFDDTFEDGVRKPSPREQDEIDTDEQTLKMLLAWKLTMHLKRKRR